MGQIPDLTNGTSMRLRVLRAVLTLAWCRETARGDWTPLEPSLNQCVPTALVVQDCLGGVILRSRMTDGDSHYWNKASDGLEIDFTRAQFDYIDEYPLRDTKQERSREELLSNSDTARRYELLKARVNSLAKELAWDKSPRA